ncbi:MAG: hypothetical protein ABID40_03095, partial [Candidatus Bipolaricaulota bacterium]
MAEDVGARTPERTPELIVEETRKLYNERQGLGQDDPRWMQLGDQILSLADEYKRAKGAVVEATSATQTRELDARTRLLQRAAKEKDINLLPPEWGITTDDLRWMNKDPSKVDEYVRQGLGAAAAVGTLALTRGVGGLPAASAARVGGVSAVTQALAQGVGDLMESIENHISGYTPRDKDFWTGTLDATTRMVQAGEFDLAATTGFAGAGVGIGQLLQTFGRITGLASPPARAVVAKAQRAGIQIGAVVTGTPAYKIIGAVAGAIPLLRGPALKQSSGILLRAHEVGEEMLDSVGPRLNLEAFGIKLSEDYSNRAKALLQPALQGYKAVYDRIKALGDPKLIWNRNLTQGCRELLSSDL